MQELLLKINEEIKASTTQTLDSKTADSHREKYRQIIVEGILEMPTPKFQDKKRGRQKKRKST